VAGYADRDMLHVFGSGNAPKRAIFQPGQIFAMFYLENGFI